MTPPPLLVMWQEWQRGKLPCAGGYAEQPLKYMALVNAIEMIFNTLKMKAGDWTKMTPEQAELVKWLET